MSVFHLVMVALIQGLTEFLPISSSGHLRFYSLVTGEDVSTALAIEVAVHLGTLAAVIVYFRREVEAAAVGGVDILRRRRSGEARLARLLIIATLPVVAAGLALSMLDLVEDISSLAVIGWSTLIFGVTLWVADRWGAERRTVGSWRTFDAVIMGLAQAAALIPGASRSGMTITAARALGYERVDAARLSMLMSIPTILAAGTLVGLDLVVGGGAVIGFDAAIAAGLSFLTALGALAVFMRMMKTWTLTPFVIYRIVVGLALLAFVYA